MVRAVGNGTNRRKGAERTREKGVSTWSGAIQEKKKESLRAHGDINGYGT